MIKRISFFITLIMLLFTAHVARAQDWGFTFGAGLASARMNDLKYLQEDILGTYPVEGKITSSFPPYTSASILPQGANPVMLTTPGKYTPKWA